MRPPLAVWICRGLTPTATGWLLGALKMGTPQALRAPDPDAAMALRALTRLGAPLETAIAGTIAEAIGHRLQQAPQATLDALHPQWRAHLLERERPDLLSRPTSSEAPWAGWGQALGAHHLVERIGWLDPRHGAEWTLGRVLEFGQLRLLPAEERTALLTEVGLTLLAAVLHGRARREQVATARRLEPALAAALLTHTAAPPSHEVAQLGRRALGSLEAGDARRPLSARLERMGLFAVAWAAGQGRQAELRGLAHAMPLEPGQRLLSLWSSARRATPASRRAALNLTLEALQAMAHQGKLAGHLHRATALLEPPDAPLSDEVPP